MTNGLIDGKAFCEVESYWIKSSAGRFQTPIQPELLKDVFFEVPCFQNTALKQMGRSSKLDPRMTQNLILQTSPSLNVALCLLHAQICSL